MKNPEEYLNNIELINPVNIELKCDGRGEFPDSYKLTDEGRELFSTIIKQAQIDAYNEALEDAIENATLMPEPMGSLHSQVLNPDSILKLKK